MFDGNFGKTFWHVYRDAWFEPCLAHVLLQAMFDSCLAASGMSYFLQLLQKKQVRIYAVCARQ